MRRGAIWAALAAVVVLALAGAAALYVYDSVPPYPVDASGARRTDGQDFARIERGRYLTTVADCAACHTATGGAPFAGGRPIETPFGRVLAPNITPDPDTGIGSWSDAEFDAALRIGRRRDHSFLYPAMPYVYYSKMSRDDTGVIRAYLATVAPVRNAVVADQLPFPFNIRLAMAAWNALYFKPKAFSPDLGQSAEWNRGAFLVEGPGHCGACHTPKTLLGGDVETKRLVGYAIQGWFAPDISNDKGDGLADWSVEDIVAYLKTGHNRAAGAAGPMAEEVAYSSSLMTSADLTAIATYLKGSASGAAPGEVAAPSPQVRHSGEAIYRDVCSACHGVDGKGVAGLYPDLVSAPSVRAADPQSLIRVVLRGARSVATDAEPTAPAMPAFGWQLSDAEVAAVLTYIRSRWDAKAAAVEPSRVGAERSRLAERSD